MTRAAARHRRARLVVGAPGAAPAGTHGDPPLQDLFVDEVRRIKSGDPLRPLIVLVGGNYLRLHLQRLLAVRLGGHANIRFLLLQDLARELGGPVMNLRGLRRLPEHGAGLLIREIVVGRTHGSYFGGIAGKEGFAEALLSTIRDLKEAALEPALLRGAAEGMRASERRRPGSDLSGRKLDDLADLYEAYDDLLAERRFHDDQDLMKAAITRAAPSDQSPAAAIVYGFYDSTWLQRELLREFLSLRETVVLFPYLQGEAGAPAEAFEYARPMLEWFESWIPTDAERDALPAGPAPAGGPEIRLLSAPGEAREAVEATRWLIDLSRRRSIPFGEMAVLYRTSEPYRDLLPEIMDSAGGVPRFLAEGTALASTPAGRALLLWLDVRREDFSRKSVIDLLSHVSRDSSAALWDRLTRQAGVVKGISDWRRKLERLAATLKHRAEPGDRRARVELQAVQALRRSVESLREALEGLPAQATWRELAAAFVDRAARILPADAPSEALAYHIEKLGALDEVASPVTLDAFIDRLRASLLEEQVRRAPEGEFQRSGIFVGSVMEARLLSFDAVALVGLVEKVFPAAPRQDPILLDEEREAIDRLAGAPRLPLKARRLEEDRLLFDLACATAGESLLLSYPRLDAASARPRNPSPFLLQAASKLAGDRIDHDALDRLEAMTRVSLAALAPRQTTSAIFAREFDLCALAAGLHDASSRRRVASFLHSGSLLHRALEAEEARWGEPRFTAHDGVILRPNLLEDLRARHPIRDQAISASRIESYAACPLAYFMREVLDLEPIDEPEQAERIDPLRRGGLVHRILFETFSALRDRGALPLTPDRKPEALSMLEQASARCFEQEEAGGIVGHWLLWEIDKERIREDLATVIGQEAEAGGAWVPAHFELRYGMPARRGAGEDPASTERPVEFGIPSGRTILLRGSIDRIEIDSGGRAVRVTDYKTGRLERYRDDSLGGGTSVQLPLYLHAAATVLQTARPGLTAESARYLSVDRTGRFREVSFSAEALRERGDDLARVLATVTNGIARGVFFAFPEREVCRWCDYRLACGEGREARFARKRSDATAKDYLHMREEIP